MNKISIIILSLILVLSLSACSKQTARQNTAEDTTDVAEQEAASANTAPVRSEPEQTNASSEDTVTFELPAETTSPTSESEAASEQGSEWDPAAPITSDEFVLSNGVRMRMTYDEVISILGAVDGAPEIPSGGSVNVSANGIRYTFHYRGGVYLLEHLQISEECQDITFFREIGPGQHIDEVFAKIPAQDTELKQWAWQVIYEYETSGHNCYLEFIAASYYTIRIETPEMQAHITFSRVGTTVKWIDIYA